MVDGWIARQSGVGEKKAPCIQNDVFLKIPWNIDSDVGDDVTFASGEGNLDYLRLRLPPGSLRCLADILLPAAAAVAADGTRRARHYRRRWKATGKSRARHQTGQHQAAPSAGPSRSRVHRTRSILRPSRD